MTMADESLVVQLSVVGGREASNQLLEVGKNAKQSLKQISDSGGSATKALEAIKGAGEQLASGFRSTSNIAAGLIGNFAEIGTIGGVVATTMAGLALTIKAVGAASEKDRVIARLDTVLRATGESAGLTTDELVRLADQIEGKTYFDDKQILAAAAALATFRSVTGDTFKEVLNVGVNISTLFGNDLNSAIVQLGKAFEDPINGLTSLKRVGVTFTATQRDLIQGFVDGGEKAKAFDVILQALKDQGLGDAAEGERKGVSGAAKGARDAWDNLLESWGRTPIIVNTAIGWLNKLQTALENVTPNQGDQAEKLAKNIRDLSTQRNALGYGDSFPSQKGAGFLFQSDRDLYKNGIVAQRSNLDAEISAKEKELQTLQQGFTDQDNAAAAARKNGELQQYLSATDDRIAIRKKEAEEKKKADADAAAKGTEKVAQNNAKIIEDLQRGLIGVADSRQAFIDGYIDRLAKGSSAAMKDQVSKMAGELFDQKSLKEFGDKTQDVLQKAAEARSKQAQTIIEEIEPREKLNKQLADYNAMLADGLLTQGQYAKAVKATQEKIDLLSDSFASGIKVGLVDYADSIGTNAERAQQAVTNAFKGMENALVSFTTTGKLNFRNFAMGIIEDIVRIQIQSNITRPLAMGLSSLFSVAGAAAGSGAGAGGTSRYEFGGAAANGMAFDLSRPMPFANGDIFTKPVLFPMAGNKAGVMGEAGAEAIMPLKRMPGGKLGVQADGGGGGSTINQTINVNVSASGGGSDPATAKLLAAEIGRQAEAGVRAIIRQERRPGGDLSNSVRL
jgi:lambda family phage tail tape measure protein